MQEYNEDEFLLLSGIQHYNFCRRQWALIHIEQQWQENVLTLEGSYLHEVADNPFIREKRKDRIIVRAMPVQSRELGLSGICDVVEFIRRDDGIQLAGEDGRFLPVPIEYKRGKPKNDDSDRSQLVAQLMCLEEMLACRLSDAYFFYDEIKRRVEVQITAADKENVRATVLEMHKYFQRRLTPKARVSAKCKACSLYSVCLPELTERRSVTSFIEGRLRE
jgi:CRISPR-associated exonuclease Cas4